MLYVCEILNFYAYNILILSLRPQIGKDYPPNLSILVSGGKETNQDFLSSGERTGKSPAPNPAAFSAAGRCGVREGPLSFRRSPRPSSS